MTGNLEIMSQRSAPGLIRNGNFAHGSAYWHGSYLRQLQTSASSSSVRTRYAMEITRPAEGAYLSTQEPGMWQYLDRPDLVQFPSSRLVTGLEFIPLGYKKAGLRVLKQFSTIDGKVLDDLFAVPLELPLENYTSDLIFQHPFVHTGTVQLKDGPSFAREQYEVRQKPGDALPLTDTFNDTNSGVYRVGQLLLNYSGIAFIPGDTVNAGNPQLDRFTYHGLTVVPPADVSIQHVANQLTDGISGISIAATSEFGVDTWTVTIDASAAVINALPRFQVVGVTGLRDGDIFVVEAPLPGVGTISNLNVGATQTTFTLALVINQSANVLFAQPPAAQDQEPMSWAIFPKSVANVTRTLPVYRYDMTVAMTYKAAGEFLRPALPILEFRQLEADGNIDGFGRLSERIVAESAESLDVRFELPNGNEDLTYRRYVNRIIREFTVPQDGRAALRIQPPQSGDAGEFSGLVKSIEATTETIGGSPVEVVSVAIDLGVPTILIPDWLAVGKVALLTSTPGVFADQPWINTLLDVQPQIRVLTSSIDTSGATSVVTVTSSYLPSFGNFFFAQNQPWPAGTVNEVPIMSSIAEGAVRCQVSDVYACKGDITQRVAISDDNALPPGTTLNDTVSVDPLVHRVDLLDNVISPGTVVMYAGGGICPPGFKRLQGFANSGTAPVVTLPLPSSTTYDSITDRTTLVWNNEEFSLLDEAGAPIELIGATNVESLEVGTGNVNFETIEFPSFQQLMQPGMQVRFNGATIPPAELAELSVSDEPGNAIQLGGGDQGFYRGGLGSAQSLVPTNEAIVDLWFKYNPGAFDNSQEHWIANTVNIDDNNTAKRVGWGIKILTDGRLQAVMYIRANSTYLTSTATTDDVIDWANPTASGSTVGGWFHVAALFKAGSSFDFAANPGSGANYGATMVVSGAAYNVQSTTRVPFANQVTGTGIPINDDSVFLQVGAAEVLSGNPISTADVTIDHLRIGAPNEDLTTYAQATWNNAKGTPVLPSTILAEYTLYGDYRFDTPSFGVVTNQVGPTGASSALTAASFFDLASVPGHVKAVLPNVGITLDSFRAAAEDQDPAFLITDVNNRTSQLVGSLVSAVPTDPSGNTGGQGQGVVGYPNFVGLGGLVSQNQGQQPTPPVGPSAEEQTETFSDGLPFDINVGTSLLFEGGVPVGYYGVRKTQFLGGPPVPLAGSSSVFEPSVGDVLWLSVVDKTVGTIVRCTAINQFNLTNGDPARRYIFKRYDGQQLFGTEITEEISDIGVISVRPAKLYGVGQHTIDGNGNVAIAGVVQTNAQTDIGQVWSTRALESSTTLTVAGQLELPEDVVSLRVEAGGYVRYDEPDTQMNYGSGGHSHEILNGSGGPTGPTLPRVKETGSTSGGAFDTEDIPFTPVAAEHDHGFLDTYRFPMPLARLVTLCQKL